MQIALASKSRRGSSIFSRYWMARSAAGKEGCDDATAIDALFPSNPLPNSHNEIGDAVFRVGAKNPGAATQLVRAHMESVFNEATKNLQGGPNQFGGASSPTS
jgi:hypothetical protein